MKITLLSYTPDARELLIFTKNTRLRMIPEGLARIKEWPEEQKQAELEYMRGTIQSSWEFVDYVFLIEEVTRAFTHQLVRHRVGTSFAQQSQRTVDMSDFAYAIGPTCLDGVRRNLYDGAMNAINKFYKELLKLGAPEEDARGILPTNIHTSIVFKANLRTLHDMAAKRLCLVKTQAEFQHVMLGLRTAVLRVHPWADRFLRVECVTTGVCPFAHVEPHACPIKLHTLNRDTGQSYLSTEKENVFATIGTEDELQNIWRGQVNGGAV